MAARESINLALSFDKRVENSISIAKDLFAKGIIEENGGRYLKSSMDNFERFDQYIIEG